MSFEALNRRAREARAWLHEACFPLWASAGVNGEGGFREILSLQHTPEDSSRTRVRVQARQTYVFAQALRQGWQPKRARRLIEQGVALLCGPSLRRDGVAGRWLAADARSLTDETADLYDTAFVLYALAEAHHALRGEGETARLAASTIHTMTLALERAMRSPSGGFAETLPAPQTRLQNPHMHLLEACLALSAAGLEPVWARSTADDIIALFDTRFTEGPGGLLGEKFSADWSPPSGGAAGHVEPGHQFEWVWLLHRYARQTGTKPSEAGQRLYAFGLSTLDAQGRAVMEVTRDGQAIDGSARTWSQTEALKASLARLEATGDDRCARDAVARYDVLMDHFLTAAGGWRDHFAADGTPLAQNMPASTGYHVVLALAELIRLGDMR